MLIEHQAADASRLTSVIRIVIADDHAIFRDSLRLLLESAPDFDVVGATGTAAGAIALVAETKPDVLLLDVNMPGLSGLDALRRLDRDIAPRVIVLTAAIGRSDILRAVTAGARGVVMKHAASDVLVKSIRAIMNGEYWLSRDLVGDLVELACGVDACSDREPAHTFGLTERERDVIAAVVAGCTNRDVAAKYGISEDTVKHHLTNIFNKTGTSTRLELALFSVHHRLVPQT